MENGGNGVHRKLCEMRDLAHIWGILVRILFCMLFLLTQFFCMSRYLYHMRLPQILGELCPVHRGHALAGPSTHAPALTSSFFAHVKNLWFKKKKRATLVSMYATLKHPYQGTAKRECSIFPQDFIFCTLVLIQPPQIPTWVVHLC